MGHGRGLSGTLLAVAGQGLSSGSNLLFQLALASALSPTDFGTIVAGLSVYYLCLAAVRAGVGDVLLARPETRWKDSLRLALLIGLAGSALLGGGAVLADEQGAALIGLAVAMPVLMANDALRYRAWSQDRHGVVVGMDAVWAGAVAAAFAVALAGEPGGYALVSVWALGGLLATFIGLGGCRELPGSEVADPHAVRSARVGFLSDQLPSALATNLLPVLLALVVSPALAAAHRAALLPFMAIETVVFGLRVTLMSELSSAASTSDPTPGARRVAVRLVAISGVLAGIVLIVLATPLRDVLGESGDEVGLWFLAAGALVVLRAGGRPFADVAALRLGMRRTLAVRTASSVLELVVGLVAGAFGSLGPLLIGRATVVGATGVAWHQLLRRSATSST